MINTVRGALALLVALALVVAAPTAEASSGERTAEDGFVTLINQERTARGLKALEGYWDLVDDARAHSKQMAQKGDIYHNPDLAGVTDGWYLLGENVGVGPNVEVLHQAFMDSSGHRANVLHPDYNYVGVGVVIDADGAMWVTVVFMHGPTGLVVSFNPPFADDDESGHERAINALAAAGIAQGCTPEFFCPNDPVTRGQMASFLSRALGLPAASGGPFTDVAGSGHRAAIDALAAAGITEGCTVDRYCPDQALTRAQMASLLVRALDLPSASGQGFVDTGSSRHAAAIDALAAAGITQGCTVDRYCPEQPVTRAQMASFLYRALGLGS